jgi:hypothetical protein
MAFLFADIETMRSRDEAALEARFPLPVEPPPVPDIGTLKNKALKDPEKLAAWREQKHRDLVEDRDANIANAKQKRDDAIRAAWESSSLDALLGGVLCVGVARGEANPTVIFEASEEATLRKLQAGLDAYPDDIIVGYNILGFDAPFLARRAMKYGLGSLVRRMFIDKPWGRRGIIDLRQSWAMGDRYAKGKLPEVAAHMGIPVTDDTIGGADVPRLWVECAGLLDSPQAELIRKHVICDVELTRAVAQKLQGFGVLEAA